MYFDLKKPIKDYIKKEDTTFIKSSRPKRTSASQLIINVINC